MLNNWTGMGRLTKDPETRTTQSGKFVTSFTLAIDRDYDREKTDFVSCVAWGKTGEFVDKYIHKGNLIAVNGSWQSREWTDKNNNKRLSWDVNVSNVYFCESKKTATSFLSKETTEDDFVELPDDGDLPF